MTPHRLFLPALLAVASLGFLVKRLYGILAPYRDSGDLVTSAFTLGIAHPPGYALYNLLTKIGMIVIPFGNFAYRANFLSALWTAMAMAVLFAALRRFTGPLAAAAGALVWFVSPSVQRLSIVSEMYSLNALFASMILFAVFSTVTPGERVQTPVRARRGPVRALVLAFFLLGLGLLNQPVLVFVLPGLLAYWWVQQGQMDPGRSKSLLYFLVFGAIGFTLIIYYPVRSFQSPVVDWGDPETPRALWRLVTRADYGGLRLHPEDSRFAWSFRGLLDQAGLFLRSEWRDLGLLGVGFGVAGFVFALRNSKGMRAVSLHLCGISFLVSAPFFFVLSNLPVGEETTLPILEPYLVMANLFAVPWIALGIERAVSPLEDKRLVRNAVFALLIGAILVFLPPGRRGEFHAYDFGKNALRTMPPGSSLYDPDDTTTFVLSYLQNVEQRRKDVVLLTGLRTFWGYEQLRERHPNAVPKGDFKSAPEFIRALLVHQIRTGRPLFTDHSSKYPPGLDNYPVGLLSRAGKVSGIGEFRDHQKVFHFYVERGDSSGLMVDRREEFFSRHLVSRYSAALNNIGIMEQGRRHFMEAEIYFRKALTREPSQPQAWSNLGINSTLQEDHERAIAVFEEGVRKSRNPEMLYYYMALSQKKLGRLKQAVASLEEALRINPRNAGAMNEQGLIRLDKKNWIQARSWFERAVQANGGYAPAHYNLGLALRRLGFNGEAAGSFKKYLDLSPNASDKTQVRRWIKRLRRR